MNVNIKISSPQVLPVTGSIHAVGMDLKADIQHPVIIKPNEKAEFSTGVSAEIPVGYEGQVRHRSSLFKRGLVIMGTIDPDYRGEIMVIAWNVSTETQVIMPLDRVAQLIISPVVSPKFTVVDQLSETDRGGGGFGSTGR